MKKLLLTLICITLLVSTVSALDFDNIKSVKETIGKAGYNDIQIDNAFGLGSRLWYGTLESNTHSCGQFCEATQTITLDSKEVLIDDVLFERIYEDGSREETNIRSYKILIKTGQQPYEVDDYEYQCETKGYSKNGTAIKECSNVKVGSHTEYTKEWQEYELGTEMNAGTYEVKLEGEKKPSWSVDWIYKTQGKTLEEWAVWGSSNIWDDVTTYYTLNDTLIDIVGTAGTLSASGGHSFKPAIIENGTEHYGANELFDVSMPGDFPTGDETRSISIWLNYTSCSGTCGAISMGNPTGADTTIAITLINDDDLAINDGGATTIIKSTLTANQWYHVVLTYDTADNKIMGWVDGVNTANHSTTNLNTNNQLRIATYDGSGDWSGAIDEIGFWNKTLNSLEINALYNGGNGISYGNNFNTITLNSPEDNYIPPSTEVEFNCSAQVTGGATLTNMSLWHNGTGVWELNETIDAYSEYQENVTGENYNQYGSSTSGKNGLKFQINQDSNLYSVEKDSLSLITKAYLLDSSKNVLATSDSFIGNTAIFSTEPTLTAGTTYYIAGDREGVSFTRTYDPGWAGFPVEETYLNWTGGLVDGADNSENIFEIYGINIGIPGSTITETFNVTLNEPTLWTCQACDSDGDCGFAENRTVLIDTTAPTINISYPNGIINYGAAGTEETLNVTLTDTNLDSCWYDYNGTNVSIDCTSGVLNSSTFILEAENYNLTFYANDTVGNEASELVEWEYKIFEVNRSFNSITTVGAIQDYFLNTTLGSGYEISSIIFNYNGLTESPIILSSGRNRDFIVENLYLPIFETDTNMTFNYTIILTDSTSITTHSSIVLLNSIPLDNCSSYSNQILNLSLYDEINQEPLEGDIEVVYNIENKPFYDTINTLYFKAENINNTLVCTDFNTTNQNLSYSAEIRYQAEGCEPELYHISRADLDDNPEQINLYDLNSSKSTEFKIIYQDSTFNFVEGAVVQLLRKYISEDVYKVVEAPLTSSEGIAVLHVDLDSIKYKAIVVKNGEVLDTFDNLVFKCNSELTGECEQKLLGEINPQNEIDYDTTRDFSYSISESNGTVAITFSIPSSEPSNVNIQLVQTDQFGNETLCNESVTSSAGSIDCTYSTTIGDSYLDLYIYKNGEPIAYQSYIIPEESGLDLLNNNFFIVFVLLLSLVGMAMSSPEWIVVNGIVTFVIAGALFLLNGLNFVVGLGTMLWLIIGGTIIIFKLAKQEDR